MAATEQERETVESLLEELGEVFASHVERRIERAFEHGEVHRDDLIKSATLRWTEITDWIDAIEWFVEEHGEISPGRYGTVGQGGPKFYSGTLIEMVAMHRGYETEGERVTDGPESFDFVIIVKDSED